jgi:hypothetical protein
MGRAKTPNIAGAVRVKKIVLTGLLIGNRPIWFAVTWRDRSPADNMQYIQKT